MLFEPIVEDILGIGRHPWWGGLQYSSIVRRRWRQLPTLHSLPMLDELLLAVFGVVFYAGLQGLGFVNSSKRLWSSILEKGGIKYDLRRKIKGITVVISKTQRKDKLWDTIACNLGFILEKTCSDTLP